MDRRGELRVRSGNIFGYSLMLLGISLWLDEQRTYG